MLKYSDVLEEHTSSISYPEDGNDFDIDFNVK
jgi:hypothetical protein